MTEKPISSDRSRLVALILVWLFGFFAAHRFYVGKVGSGFVMLLLNFLSFFAILAAGLIGSTSLVVFFGIIAFGSCIWWAINFFEILFGNFTDKQGRPLKKWISEDSA